MAAQQILDFMEDANRLEEAGRSARDLAERQFDGDLLAKKLEGILQSVRGGKLMLSN